MHYLGAAGHGLLPHRAADGFRRNALPRAAEDEEPLVDGMRWLMMADGAQNDGKIMQVIGG